MQRFVIWTETFSTWLSDIEEARLISSGRGVVSNAFVSCSQHRAMFVYQICHVARAWPTESLKGLATGRRALCAKPSEGLVES